MKTIILFFKINISLIDLYVKNNGKNIKILFYFVEEKEFFIVKVYKLFYLKLNKYIFIYSKALTKKNIVNHKEDKLNDKTDSTHYQETNGTLFSNFYKFYNFYQINLYN